MARALWLRPPRTAFLRTENLALPGQAELLIRTLFSAVSRGTETLVYDGGVPESEYERMRAPFQQGTLPGPVKHGYASVGVVEAGPPPWPGRQVFCLYPHQTRYVVPVDAALPLPAHVPPERAVLAANMETAVNALWDAPPRIGDRVAVVGAGVLGSLLAALAARVPGVRVQLIDREADRAAIAAAFGAVFRCPEDADGDQDLVFHASASEAGLDTALGLAGAQAEVIELSWYGRGATRVRLGGAFHARRLSLRASQVGTVAPARAARWSHRRRLALALELCADSRLDCLFNVADAGFEALPAVMARLADPADRSLCQRIAYREESPCTS